MKRIRRKRHPLKVKIARVKRLGGFTRSIGIRVFIPELPQFSFAATKWQGGMGFTLDQIKNWKWVITETSTGHGVVASQAKTPQGALRNTRARIREALDLYGATPRQLRRYMFRLRAAVLKDPDAQPPHPSTMTLKSPSAMSEHAKALRATRLPAPEADAFGKRPLARIASVKPKHTPKPPPPSSPKSRPVTSPKSPTSAPPSPAPCAPQPQPRTIPMAENSNIEWCDHTFNPWIGCTKVSPGCANCYAEAQMDKRLGKVHWGKGQPRRRTSAANWALPLKWNEAEDRKLVSHGDFVANRRPRVFCASLADILDPEVPAKWVADLLDLIRITPNLDWLLLTKRPELWRDRLGKVAVYIQGHWDADPRFLCELHRFIADWINATNPEVARRHPGYGEPPANVWMGTTVENQLLADERIPALLRIPANVRFLSCEPLLGPVDLSAIPTGEGHGLNEAFPRITMNPLRRALQDAPHIHWVICGGESGPNARPMNPDWAQSLRDQCAEADVPFLFKQWGEWAPWHTVESAEGMERCVDDTSKRVHVSQQGVAHGNPHLPGDFTMYRLGKHRSGRHLDGVEHNAFPEVHHG
jgi:protein gp37